MDRMDRLNSIKYKLTLKPQERSGHYKFDGELYMTHGFIVQFGDDARDIAIQAHQMIQHRVNSPAGADYLQIFEYDNIKFYVIDDITHATILLREDY